MVGVCLGVEHTYDIYIAMRTNELQRERLDNEPVRSDTDTAANEYGADLRNQHMYLISPS